MTLSSNICVFEQPSDDSSTFVIGMPESFLPVLDLTTSIKYEALEHMRKRVPAVMLIGAKYRSDRLCKSNRKLLDTHSLRNGHTYWHVLAIWDHIELQFDKTYWDQAEKLSSIAAELDGFMSWWDDNQHCTRRLVIRLDGLLEYWENWHISSWEASRKYESCLKPLRTWLREKRMPDRRRIKVVLNSHRVRRAQTETYQGPFRSRFRAGIEDMIEMRDPRKKMQTLSQSVWPSSSSDESKAIAYMTNSWLVKKGQRKRADALIHCA